jgi:hypothetical protein
VVRFVGVLAAVFLAAHLPSLPPTLEDLDSVNFALGVRDFDVGRHQPHPPGYPLFIAIAKPSTGVLRAAGAGAPEVYGLAVWSAIGGAVMLLAAFVFYRRLVEDDWTALIGVVLLAGTPLFWFTSLRPLSDVAGLAAAFTSLAAVMVALRWRDRWTPQATRALLFGAAAAGIAVGFRSQSALLTFPLLIVALVRPGNAPQRVRHAAAAAFALAVLAWAVPLVVASGGPAGYLTALGAQAGEDFSGVEMLWTHRTIRAAVGAALNTFVRPWHAPVLAGVVLALAAGGALVLARAKPSAVLILTLVFGPYALFHLLFHETVTVRYALPLVPAIAVLAAATLAQARPAAALLATVAVSTLLLAHAVPAAARFGRTPSPIFGALSEMTLIADRGAPPVVAAHRRVRSESRRAREWTESASGTDWLPSPRDYEWLEAVRALRESGDRDLWFLADPRRTDLALIDSEFRRTREYRWPFNRSVYVGGARPDQVDWHIYHEPGWFLERGWALTPEVAGITERDGWGPHRQSSIGWLRRRAGETVMLLGGRHLGRSGEPPVRLIAAVDNRPIQTIEVQPGFFMRFITLPDGALAGDGRFAKLTVRAEPVAADRPPRVGLEQFNFQSAGIVQAGFGEGWHEPEYDPATAQSWRWMSETAVVQLHPAGRGVTLQVRGESPLRYFDSAPLVRISAGQRVISETRPADDFTVQVSIPSDVIAAARGRVVLESSAHFVPADRGGTADRRHLALRIYSVRVRGLAP